MLTDKIGLYLHVPFCEQKCLYCDFYSFCADSRRKKAYAAVLRDRIADFGERLQVSADTIYIGGGTPTVLSGDELADIITEAKHHFGFQGGEITVEANPADDLKETFKLLKSVGVNRLSLGVQSAIEDELVAIGRRHTNADVVRTVADAKSCGIDNISLDLMLGLPGQTPESLNKTLDFLVGLSVEHISAYILKVEPGTPFGKMNKQDLKLPDDDAVSRLYMQACEHLRGNGFEHYEISNFAKKGYRSKHNMKYWQGSPYLGIGPSAHSFLGGRRFYFERDIDAFMNGAAPVEDGVGGEKQEFVMLRLRLSNGLDFAEYMDKFGETFIYDIKMAQRLCDAGLISLSDKGISLTEKGFLVSNAIISKFI